MATETQRLIVELGVILGKTTWNSDEETTVTVPNRLVEEVMHAAIELAPARFADKDGPTLRAVT